MLAALVSGAGFAYTVAPVHPPGVAVSRLTPACSRRAAVAVAQMPDAPPEIVSSETYSLMIRALLETENSITSEIQNNYEMIDYGFLQMLDERITSSDGEEKEKLEAVKVACTTEMSNRVQAAAAALQDILQSPTAVVMEGKIAGLARQGKLDSSLLELLDMNYKQAAAAGEPGKQAAAVLGSLKNRVQDELDKQLPPVQQLLRKLLRTDDKTARARMLREKMASKGKSSIILAGMDGKEQDDDDGEPEVPPRELSQALLELKQRFGNVDENYDTGFVKKLEMVGDEAEAIALELAGGKEVSAQEQQDMMWDRGTVSVFELEKVEDQAHEEGKLAVWEKEAQDQIEKDTAARAAAIESDINKGQML